MNVRWKKKKTKQRAKNIFFSNKLISFATCFLFACYRTRHSSCGKKQTTIWINKIYWIRMVYDCEIRFVHTKSHRKGAQNTDRRRNITRRVWNRKHQPLTSVKVRSPLCRSLTSSIADTHNHRIKYIDIQAIDC